MSGKFEGSSTGGDIPAFIEKWRKSAGAERANKDSFLSDLCVAIGVPAPDPTIGDAKRDKYVFEKAVQVATETGKTTKFIDLYKHGSFVLEAKQGSESNTGKLGTAKRDTPTWNVAMNAAFGQAIDYAAALDQPPPFIIVTDIGYCFDVYASFDGSPRYRPFPNALGHRFFLTRLAERADTLRSIFLDPLSLDPSKVAVEVTREVAAHLADLTRRLEKSGHAPEAVADFLMKVIFTLFAEDVGLLQNEMFTTALRDHWIPNPRSFTQGVENLWRAMNDGAAFGFFGKLLHFNGGLFKSPVALPLAKGDLEVLLEAANCSWSKVEPAIFGTLFEGALDKKERHSLGAHFTPRAYVERLLLPALEDPIRDDWNATQAKVRALASGNKIKEAKVEAREFMKRLSEIRVLDPACGSGNFLVLALDVMKAIEDEAFALLLALEGGQTELCLDASEVTPKQFLGIEINPRAKAIADLVLWIGYLQWHFRTRHRGGKPREPVLEDYKNIECRDAMVTYDAQELVRDERTGKPLVRWDGQTMKRHAATGELVPDERFTMPVFSYRNSRKATWPEADFIVGNPPFVGGKRLREALGDGYVDALRAAHAEVPDGTDLVVYWWARAAAVLRAGNVRRFGFITTNSITQSMNRRATESALFNHEGHALLWAIPDHPWVDSKTGAAVRIAMTVAGSAQSTARLARVVNESGGDGEAAVSLSETVVPRLHSDLTGGSSVVDARPLRANSGLCSVALVRFGEGFVVDRDQAANLESSVVHPLLTGRDLNQESSENMVIDFYPLDEREARERAPAAFQHVLVHVKPARDQIRDPGSRERWWRFGRDKPELRRSLSKIKRYIATSEVSKHRVFSFVQADVRPDHSLVVVASDDALLLGVLSSRVHVVWAKVAGSRLGVGNDLRYNRSVCFDPFPFPACAQREQERIREIGDQLDAHRKARRAKDSSLTITGIYNVLAKLRAGEPLSDKERAVHDAGLVSILKKLHDDLDDAVLSGYGWPSDLTDDQIVERLVLLNAERVAEEQEEYVRWVRPEFQQASGATPEPVEVDSSGDERPGVAKTKPPKSPGIATTRAVTGKRKSKRAAH